MSDKFSVDVSITDDELEAKLRGQIDEDLDLKQLESFKGKSFIFDFNNVSGINSCGIREWINFLREIPQDSQVRYTNCPQVIIEQMNMVKGFLPEGASITSFYGPFFCEKCENEEKVLLRPEDIQNEKAPSNLKCSACGEEGLDFDALPGQYFHFLK